jgi:hypothetical protein
MHAKTPAIPDLEPLRRDWPEWSFWTSRAGSLVCATRRRHLTRVEASSGLSPTLIERDVAALTVQLERERDKESTCLPLI